MQPILARLRAAPAVDYRTMPMEAARKLFEETSRPWNQGGPIVPSRELRIPSSGYAMRARLYRPRESERLPLTVFVHGGGWVFGSIDTHDGNMRRLASASSGAVLGIDYRLAPEHPFPTPLEDVLAALAYAESGALGQEVDAARLALAGDSAGANLLLAALLRRRDEGKAPLRGAALFYGCYLPLFTTPSHASLGNGDYLLTTEMMRWYWRQFLGAEGFDTKSLAAPYRADLAGLPPLYLLAAGLDPLLDDTVMLAEKLARAGIDFRFDHVPGVVHGYLRMAGELSAARRSIEAAGRFLAEHF
ncbi:MAG: alpha/beta hydrolase [Hyphomicrobiales bacterium]